MQIFYYTGNAAPNLLLVRGSTVLNGQWPLKMATDRKTGTFIGAGYKEVTAHFLIDVPTELRKGDYQEILGAVRDLAAVELHRIADKAGHYASIAHVKHPNTPESDAQAQVLHEVTMKNGSTRELMARDPLDAINKVNRYTGYAA